MNVTRDIEPMLEETAHVAAPPSEVWALVSDLPRIAEWSPQVVRTRSKDKPMRLGSTMTNLNRRGLLFWPTHAKVVRYDDGREIAFKIKENLTVWSFLVEPEGEGGTGSKVTHRRDAGEGTSGLSDFLVRRVLGGQKTFQAELRAGMRQTLAGVKTRAESAG